MAMNMSEYNGNAKVITLDLDDESFRNAKLDDSDVSIAQTHLTNMSKLAFVGTPYEKNIDCIYGDSNCVDLSSYKTKVKMVYVDGGHDLRTLESDTKNALEMLPIQKEELSCVIWHDYLNRNYNVTDYLDEMSKKLDLYHVEETMIVFYLKNASSQLKAKLVG